MRISWVKSAVSFVAGLTISSSVQAGPLAIPANQSYRYQGRDELGAVCSVSVASNANGKLSSLKTHGTVYIDGVIVRAGGSGQGQFQVQDNDVDFDHPGQQRRIQFSDYPFGDGLHVDVHDSNPPGVTGIESDLTIDLSGSSLGALTAFDLQGGNVAFFAHTLCRDLVLAP